MAEGSTQAGLLDDDLVARRVSIHVLGTPRPQGSMRLHRLPNGGTAARYPAAVYEWRHQVQQAVAELDEEQFTGPVELKLGFEMPRPNGHFGTGRNAGVLKPSAPRWPGSMPDLDKLIRCVCDAITDAALWKDDGQVCLVTAAKRYVEVGNPTGVWITVSELW